MQSKVERYFWIFLSLFFVLRKKRLKFLNKKDIFFTTVKGRKDNLVSVPKNKNIKITIIGKNNKINISEDISFKSEIRIQIVGDNNIVEIGKALTQFELYMGAKDNRPVYNCHFKFGNSFSGRVVYTLLENNSSIMIGDGCMFSTLIEMCGSDHHAIMNEKNEVINLARSIEIGDHVWIGKGVLILKNSKIPSGCIVGANSVVTKSFETPNSVIAGNPARKVKEGIHWDEARPDMYKPA